MLEEFERQRYVRDNEDPIPWNIQNLAHKDPTTPSLGFYPLSKFTIFKSSTSTTLDFPSFTLVSNNHYKAEWSLTKTLRRLKNVIVVLEWHPSSHGTYVIIFLLHIYLITYIGIIYMYIHMLYAI